MDPHLTKFLLARFREDEAAARDALTDPVANWGAQDWIEIDGTSLAHVRRHDPHRVLERCKAGRWIVREYEDARCDFNRHEPTLEFVVRLLAMPYAEHADFDPAWAIPGWANFKMPTVAQ
ncbi:MAG: DUF6221 family protein [Frankiaceae bacterium]|jgi:hypothetical protein